MSCSRVPKRKTHEEYLHELDVNGMQIEVLQPYINNLTTIKHRCKIHNEIHNEKPLSALKFGLICCQKRKRTSWNTETWISASKKIYDEKFDYSKTTYFDAFKKITLTCPTHGEIKVNPLSHLEYILKKSGEKNLGCSNCNYERNYDRQRISVFNVETQRKVCLTCRINKPILDFTKNKDRSDGFDSNCRECKSEQKKEQRIKKQSVELTKIKIKFPGVYINPNKRFQKKVSFFFPDSNEKICSKCNERKNVKEFYGSRSSDDGYSGQCKHCTKIGQKRYYQKKYETFEGRIENFLKNAGNNAKKRKQVFQINQKILLNLWQKQEKKCFFTGIEMITQPNDLYSVSLDRINSDIGYEEKNILFVTNFVNRMKSNFQVQEFLTFCELVNAKNKNTPINVSQKIQFIDVKYTESDQRKENNRVKGIGNKSNTVNVKRAIYYPLTNEKKCGKCYNKKDVKFFYKHNATSDGYHSWCKNCCRAGNRKSAEKKYSNFSNRVTTLLYTSKNNSLKRKQDFSINRNHLNDLWEKQKQKCFYSDIKMTTQPNHIFTVSIERVDPVQGYIPQNVVLVCNAVNRMKSDFLVQEFFHFCQLITNYNAKS